MSTITKAELDDAYNAYTQAQQRFHQFQRDVPNPNAEQNAQLEQLAHEVFLTCYAYDAICRAYHWENFT